ncbi:MAG: hypothetical protein PVI70_14900 [Gammaproteobacteria bacterium]|jgi:uncharacterized spore protein YtfJ
MDELRASEIHSDGAMKIIAIESVHCCARKFGGLYHLSASIEPAAVVVCEADDIRVVGLAAANPSLEELKQRVRGLGEMLARA